MTGNHCLGQSAQSESQWMESLEVTEGCVGIGEFISMCVCVGVDNIEM